MEILAWNIRSGGGVRSHAIAAELIRRDPDVIVVGEYQTGTSARLMHELEEAGWAHQVRPDPPGRYGGVAVLSKSQLVVRPLPASLLPFAFRFVAVGVPAWGLELRAVYAPLHKDPYAEFWDAMLASLESESDGQVLMVGDLNTGRSHVDAPVPNFFCSSYFSELPSRGYTDLWREMHGPDAREYTWLGRVNPYRLDHAFGTAPLRSRLRACSYDHAVRESGLSDHSLLLVRLAPQAGEPSN